LALKNQLTAAASQIIPK